MEHVVITIQKNMLRWCIGIVLLGLLIYMGIGSGMYKPRFMFYVLSPLHYKTFMFVCTLITLLPIAIDLLYVKDKAAQRFAGRIYGEQAVLTMGEVAARWQALGGAPAEMTSNSPLPFPKATFVSWLVATGHPLP